MEKLPISLKPVERIEILTLIDNYIDLLLPGTEVVSRPVVVNGFDILSDTLVAEHGLSLLVTVYEGENKFTILFDTGYSQIGVPHNMGILGVDIEAIDGIVMSHGHVDHTGALCYIAGKLSRRIPLVLHPDVFTFPRFIDLGEGQMIQYPQILKKSDLEDKPLEIIETKSPTLLDDNRILVTGEVERLTSFEKGPPNALAIKDGNLEKDQILDDQSLVIHLKGKGLVIISGCSHAGIINTILHAEKAAGEEKVHAVVGGFHLTGAHYEPMIEATIDEFRKIAPEIIVPTHCTGWKAVNRFSEEFSEAFILNSVGSTIILQ